MGRDLTPDFYIRSYTELSPSFFKENGIRGLLTDLDDTLVPHNSMDISATLFDWTAQLRSAGIEILLLSNNKRARVEPFAKRLGVPFLSRALKPTCFRTRRASAVLNIPPEECILMGDQIFTDIAAAKRLNMRSVLVDPVGQKSTRYVQLKRRRERKKRSQLKRVKINGSGT